MSASQSPSSQASAIPESLLDALTQAKLHIDAALSHAGAGTYVGSSNALAQALRAMDPTNSGCSNCSCGGGGGGSERAQIVDPG